MSRMPGRPRLENTPRREQWRRYKAKKCRAASCRNIPIEEGGLCDYHLDLMEDGIKFALKTVPNVNCQPLGLVPAQKQAAREAMREVIEEVKRKRAERKAQRAGL